MKKTNILLFCLTILFPMLLRADMNRDSKIYVAGGRGLVGSAIIRYLNDQGYYNIITRSSKELDLRNEALVAKFFEEEKPQYVFLAAAKVGGIIANSTYPAEFIYDNLKIATNIIHQSYLHNVKKLLFLGSSCIYPKHCPQPMKEEYLLSGYLEPTNDAYALAKIAALHMCKCYNKQYKTKFISCMPTNLYGTGDNFDLKNSHVIPALIRKFCAAKKEKKDVVEIWGTGKPKREFLHVDDLAKACVFLMNNYEENETINVGTGRDISIGDLATLVKDIVGFEGELKFNSTMPDGTPRKLLDVDKISKLGWQANIPLKEGLSKTIDWYQNNY
jgi:GDP-L-fucose synthase